MKDQTKPRLTKREEILVNFKYHPPSDEQRSTYENLRSLYRTMAQSIESYVPAGREQALAMTKLEESMMWANAGIAREPARREAIDAKAQEELKITTRRGLDE